MLAPTLNWPAWPGSSKKHRRAKPGAAPRRPRVRDLRSRRHRPRLIAFAGWLMAGAGPEIAFTAAVTTLIIACPPCALGLATPTALLVGTGRGAQLGILIRGPQVLEQTRRVDTVALDKTGTITAGTMTITGSNAAAGTDMAELLQFAAAVEHGSEHPHRPCDHRLGTRVVSAVESFAAEPGQGVRGHRRWPSGRRRSGLLDHRPVGTTDPRGAERCDCNRRGGRGDSNGCRLGWQVRGTISVADTIKPTSHDAIARLRSLGLTPILLTGDNPGAAHTIAEAAGIDDVRAGGVTPPKGKLDTIRDLQAAGKVVAMVGDGVNDAPALAAADLGIAMGTGTDAAITAADLTIVSGDLVLVPDAIRLARRTLGTIKGEPVLGVRVQHRRDPGRDARAAQPDPRRRRDGVQQRVRGHQQPPTPQLPTLACPGGNHNGTHPQHRPRPYLNTLEKNQ